MGGEWEGFRESGGQQIEAHPSSVDLGPMLHTYPRALTKALNFCQGFWARNPLRQVQFEKLGGSKRDFREDFQRIQRRGPEEVRGGDIALSLRGGASISSVL